VRHELAEVSALEDTDVPHPPARLPGLELLDRVHGDPAAPYGEAENLVQRQEGNFAVLGACARSLS
jgi:hypothetical protein